MTYLRIKRILNTVVIAVFLLLFSRNALAAEIFFHSLEPEWYVGNANNNAIAVYVNSNGVSINIVAGEISFAGPAAVNRLNIGNSIVPLWVEEPHITDTGTIKFAGMMPGGFDDFSGLLFKIEFDTTSPGEGRLQVTAAQAFLHDGAGTPVATRGIDYTYTIMPAREGVTAATRVDDTTPPEEFVPQLVRDPNILSGKWSLVFSTQDKGSGVSWYAVQEDRYGRFRSTSWQRATSPYLLQDQELRSYIFVKAVDGAGNERVVWLKPVRPLAWWEDYHIWVILVIGAVAPLVVTIVLLIRIFTKRHA